MELTQPESTEVLKISTEAASVSIISVAEESSQPGDLPEDLPSPASQPSKILEFDILTLSIVAEIIIMIASDVAPAQAEELIIDTSAKDIPVEASAEKALTVKPILEAATQEAITIFDPEALVVTSEMRQLLTQVAPIFLGGTSAPALTSESISIMNVETGLGSAHPVLTPAMNILEELTLQMVEQFFTTIKYCTELVLSGRSSFEFAQTFLEN